MSIGNHERKEADYKHQVQAIRRYLDVAEDTNGWHDFKTDPPKKEGPYQFAYSLDKLRSEQFSLEILNYIRGGIYDFYGRNLVLEAYRIFWRECPELPVESGRWVEAVFE